MHDIININQAKADIEELKTKFDQFAKDWEEGDGYSYYCTEIAEKELNLVLQKMNKYQGFIFEYNEAEYVDPKYDNWYQDQTLSHEDLYSCNVTDDNYGLADAVAYDIQTELISYLKAEIEALEGDTWARDSKIQNVIDERIDDIEDELGIVIDYTWDYYEDPKEE